jgi:hypothetical protein
MRGKGRPKLLSYKLGVKINVIGIGTYIHRRIIVKLWTSIIKKNQST